MGCTASKLDNEDTVRRCKERRSLMKQAVYARHHLASAHSDYLRSLRLTGSALSRFAAGEPLSVSDDTPPVVLRPPSSTSSASAYAPPPPPPPPPAPPAFTPPSPSIASSKMPRNHSESSPSSTPSQKIPTRKYPYFPSSASTYSTTPSQSSSAWNWENFYPPSPPDSDFFQKNTHNEGNHNEDAHNDADEERSEREEVHCSEWGDHYSSNSSTSSLSDDDNDNHNESPSKTDAPNAATAAGSNYAPSSFREQASMAGEEKFHKERSDVGSTVDGEISNMRMVVRHRNLAEIVKAIEEYFEKAAAAGGSVSDLLETGRAQLDRSFRQLKKTVYHSNSVLSNLSSSWTSKPPLAIRYRLDTGTLEDSGGGKSHGSTLERLLAWEKKLYQEVKAREGVKIEHERKLSSLQSQEYRGHEEAKLDKTKASIQRLQSLILVTSQAVSATSSSILKLRDNELALQLVELCNGFMYMWRCMNQFHEVQNHIVQQVRGLENRSLAGDSTSEIHRQATRDLESAVSAWHSNFSRLIKYQRDYVRSLHGWLKLTLHPISDEKDPSVVSSNVSSELSAFCDEWKQALERLPDTVASEAIKSFITVVHSISLKQAEELKIKKRTESASKELEKKATALRNIEKKFYHSYSMVGIGPPDGGSESGQVFDARDPLAEKKSEISACQRRVEDEMLRHTKAIEATRAMTLNNIQTGLPGVFQAMTGFSSVFAEALEVVCSRAGALK